MHFMGEALALVNDGFELGAADADADLIRGGNEREENGGDHEEMQRSPPGSTGEDFDVCAGVEGDDEGVGAGGELGIDEADATETDTALHINAGGGVDGLGGDGGGEGLVLAGEHEEALVGRDAALAGDDAVDFNVLGIEGTGGCLGVCDGDGREWAAGPEGGDGGVDEGDGVLLDHDVAGDIDFITDLGDGGSFGGLDEDAAGGVLHEERWGGGDDGAADVDELRGGRNPAEIGDGDGCAGWGGCGGGLGDGLEIAGGSDDGDGLLDWLRGGGCGERGDADVSPKASGGVRAETYFAGGVAMLFAFCAGDEGAAGQEAGAAGDGATFYPQGEVIPAERVNAAGNGRGGEGEEAEVRAAEDEGVVMGAEADVVTTVGVDAFFCLGDAGDEAGVAETEELDVGFYGVVLPARRAGDGFSAALTGRVFHDAGADGPGAAEGLPLRGVAGWEAVGVGEVLLGTLAEEVDAGGG